MHLGLSCGVTNSLSLFMQDWLAVAQYFDRLAGTPARDATSVLSAPPFSSSMARSRSGSIKVLGFRLILMPTAFAQ
jgi:hypothetical protein